jgi:hypothetical protein
MSVIISDSASLRARASAMHDARLSSKNLRLASWVRGSVRLSELEIFLQLVDLFFRGVQPLLEILIVRLHLFRGVQQAFDHRAQAVAVLRLIEPLRHFGEALGVARGRTLRGVDHRHDLLDLVHHLAAEIVDLSVRRAGER